MKENTGYCGLDCSKCECYIATINNNDELRKKVAKEWSELNNVIIPYQAINCLGCKQDSTKSIYCESICEVRKCALKSNINSCDKCVKMGECEKLKPFLDSPINIFKK